MGTMAVVSPIGGDLSAKPTNPPTVSRPAPEGGSAVHANRLGVPSSVSRPPPRRATRPISSDFLSDAATAALIRRTLCAQYLSDRGRNTPAPIEELLPPLTSRNDVDLQLYALISIILREFVQNWYNKITPDETFIAEIVQIIAHCTRALEQRLRKVDLESLLLDELPELLQAHIQAYRTARDSPARAPLEANHREIYHSLLPLPALSPVPRPDDAKSIQVQTENEAAYRQLLVQGFLAVLLPTEDLENECLTALVGQILSELIIGNLFINKLSEPWLLYEIFIMLTRLVGKRPTEMANSVGTESPSEPEIHPRIMSINKHRSWSIHQTFWAVIQWGFSVVNIIRVLLSVLNMSRSLPSRSSSVTPWKSDPSGLSHAEEPHEYQEAIETSPNPPRKAIVNFRLWPCCASLLELDARMPWLSGALSLIQWGASWGPGRIAAFDGVIDRLLSHYIQSHLLDPARLPPLLRSTRAALFPNNAPGSPSLVAPSSEAELAALRRRCASAIDALIPTMVGKMYFGSELPGSSSQDGSSRYGPQAAVGNSSSSSVSPGDKVTTDNQIAAAVPPVTASADGTSPISKPPEHLAPATVQAGELVVDQIQCHPGNEDEILSEIERSVLEPFSDIYCNKHLLYGALELILVRLVPELTRKGIIELWEERLS